MVVASDWLYLFVTRNFYLFFNYTDIIAFFVAFVSAFLIIYLSRFFDGATYNKWLIASFLTLAIGILTFLRF